MSRPGSDGPDNVDATFEEIVADLRAQGFDEPAFDDADLDRRPGRGRDGDTGDGADPGEFGDPGDRRDRTDRGDDTDRGGGVDELRRPSDEPAPTEPGWRDSPIAWDETMFGPAPGDPDDPDDHFVPPEPPPLPKPRKGALVILLLFVLGLVLLIAPSLIGMAASIATPVGMLSLAAGLALLLLRVRQGPPPGADPTNGAQV